MVIEKTYLGKILFVEWDKVTIEQIKNDLKSSKIFFDIVSHGEAALELMSRTQYDVIASVMRLPDMDVNRLFATVRVRYPNTERVFISNAAEEEKAQNFLNRKIVVDYIKKPWRYAYMVDKIITVLNTRAELQKQELQKKISNIKNIPTLPEIYNQLIDAIAVQKSYKKIAEIINKDTPISTKVLQIANSAYYGFEPTTSMTRAISLLGSRDLKDIILSFGFTNQMKWDAEQSANLKQISVHSLVVNRFIQKFYELRSNISLPTEYASIGITHDIGKIIQLQYFKEEFYSIIENMRNNPGMTYYESEIKLGLEGQSHVEIGTHFLKSWKLPEENAKVAFLHHNFVGLGGEFRKVLDVVDVVNVLANYLWDRRDNEKWDLKDFNKVVKYRESELMALGEEMRNSINELVLVT